MSFNKRFVVAQYDFESEKEGCLSIKVGGPRKGVGGEEGRRPLMPLSIVLRLRFDANTPAL